VSGDDLVVGVDVGGTNVRALVVDPGDGSVLDRARGSSAGDGPTLAATITRLVADLRDRGHAVAAVGLGVAGLAHRSGTLRYSPNLPDVVEFPLGPWVERATGLPVAMGNDATCATLAEHRLGAGRGVADFALVTLGTGIGTGFVVDGRLLRGAGGFAGESGHMVVDRNGPAHHTGQRGPWEHFAAGTALDRLLGGPVTDGEVPPDVLNDFCHEVALGVANLVQVLDPARVALGGGVSGLGEPLRGGVERWLGDLLLGGAHRDPVEVRLAELGDDAGAVGAALLAVGDDTFD